MWRTAVFLLVAASGCGDGLASRDDAAVPADGNQAAGLVHVRVVLDGGGFAHGAVYFQAADSRLLLATTLNAAGEAAGFVEPNSFVTVLGDDRDDPQQRIWTYAGVQPGDDLVIDFTPVLTNHSIDVFPFKANANLEFDFAHPPVGVSRYVLQTVCGSFPIDPPDPIYPATCPATTDLLVIALNDQLFPEDGSPFSSVLGYQFEAGHDMSVAAVHFADPFRPLDASPVTVSNAPLDAPQMSIAQVLVEAKAVVWSSDRAVVAPVDPDGTIRADLALPRPPGTMLYTTLDPSFDGYPHIIDWRPATQDVALTWPAVRAATSQPVYDATTTRIRWEESADGVPGNLARGALFWSMPDGKFASWEIVSPRGEDPVIRVPLLPRADLTPRTDVAREVESILAGDDPAAFAKLRTHLIGQWSPNGYWPFTGVSGTVVWRQAQSGFEPF